jgi:hypothetical protein
MASIQFDSTEIVNSTYVPKNIKHESIPERTLNLLELAREDGAVLVSDRYGVKRIIVAGTLKASSQTSLETQIDVFKELFSRRSKNLDISWAGGTRRYVANCAKHDFDRDYIHINFVPWTAEFVVVTGVGEDTSETTLVNNDSFTIAGPPATKTGSLTFAGSAPPRPRIRVKAASTLTEPKGISIENTDTDERIVVTRASGFGAGKYFEIDCRLKTTKYDSVSIAFNGVFPSWIIGANNFEITIGEIIDQEFYYGGSFEDYRIWNDSVTDWRNAESFMVPEDNDTYQVVSIYGLKNGTPSHSISIGIQTDDNGKPSGTWVQDASSNDFETAIAPGDFSGTAGWNRAIHTTTCTLNSNTKYWLVAYMAGVTGDVNNSYTWYGITGVNATYLRGNRSVTSSAGATWTDNPTSDLNFRVALGGIQYLYGPAETIYYDVFYYKRYL